MNELHTFHIRQESELSPVAKVIVSLWEIGRALLLVGDLGAGKTTLVKHVVRELGSTDEVTSPTFALVNQYLISSTDFPTARTVYHIDLYRISSPEEAFRMGLEEYLADPSALCCIEWPEIGEGMYHEALVVEIRASADNSRKIVISLFQ